MKKILLDQNSLYNRIVVTEEAGVRYLKFGNNIIQSAVFVNEPYALCLDYTKYMFLGLAFNPGAGKILHIGLGAGSVPKLMAKYCPGFEIEAVEVDYKVLEAARKFLDLGAEPGFKIHIMDGRIFIHRCQQKYDLIMLDAYSTEFVPPNLSTLEFFEEVKKRLNEGGVLVTNLWRSDLNFYHSELATLARVFNYIYRFPAIVKKNVIAIACDACFTYKEVKNQALKLQQKFNFPFDLEKLTRQWSGEKLDLSQYPIIRDEQVPNKWLERRRAGKR